MTKKVIAILLALVLVFGLAACAGTPAATPTPAPPAATPAPGADPTPEPAPPAASLTGTLTIIVPFSAGGSTDLMARVLQPALAERLGVNVVIENRGGGGGAPGMMALAQSAPDGHTIALTSISSATLTPNISNVGYTNVEFQPVAHISVLPTGPWARTGEGIYTLEDLIRVAS
ncbi:MAG: tripartite tricarboxylate transporter substrate-binding protein, partial [Oscillospiraceae bacterium]|nr:tripartite tricarboxylate transporter substrate-binding protein [Oscillospiraceae bacterium]